MDIGTPPPPITYYWTGLLILDHSYLIGNLTNSKIAETKALESWHFLYQQFSNLFVSQRDLSGPRLGAVSNNRWTGVHGRSSISEHFVRSILNLVSLIIHARLYTLGRNYKSMQMAALLSDTSWKLSILFDWVQSRQKKKKIYSRRTPI